MAGRAEQPNWAKDPTYRIFDPTITFDLSAWLAKSLYINRPCFWYTERGAEGLALHSHYHIFDGASWRVIFEQPKKCCDFIPRWKNKLPPKLTFQKVYMQRPFNYRQSIGMTKRLKIYVPNVSMWSMNLFLFWPRNRWMKTILVSHKLQLTACSDSTFRQSILFPRTLT